MPRSKGCQARIMSPSPAEDHGAERAGERPSEIKNPYAVERERHDASVIALELLKETRLSRQGAMLIGEPDNAEGRVVTQEGSDQHEDLPVLDLDIVFAQACRALLVEFEPAVEVELVA